MITEEQKKRIVQEILKTPIIASSTYYGKPCLVSDSKNNNYIISGQKYKGCSDEDMCDFTVGYYNVVYEKDILKNSNITEIFAGDTMIDNYKEELANYHCLANFWILPMKVGRSCGRLNRARLHMDSFLKKLLENYEGYKEYYKEYFTEFSEETFVEKHYLEGSFFVNNTVVEINTVDDARKCISMRAENLSEKKFKELYKYFEETFGKIIVDKFSGK